MNLTQITTQALFDINNVGQRGTPLVFGDIGLAVQRLDHPEYDWFLKQEEKARALIWSPKEFNLTSDAGDFMGLDKATQELFLGNFKIQSIADSLVGRTISQVFLPVVTNPKLEYWFYTHMYFENNIHSSSYLEILKAVLPNVTEVFDDIMVNPDILKRVQGILQHYENMYKMNVMKASGHPDYDPKAHYLAYLKALFALNILEGTLFYTSFLVSFAFAEQGLMTGTAKYLTKIAVDENIHLSVTQRLIQVARRDDLLADICLAETESFITMYKEAFKAEEAWIEYLFRDNPKILGLTKNVMLAFLDYNINRRMAGAGLPLFRPKTADPCTWMHKYTSPGQTQTALQEVEATEYEINNTIDDLKPDTLKEIVI